MNQQLTEAEIEKMLEHLTYSNQTEVMAQRLFFSETESIRQKGIKDKRIIDALTNIASKSPNTSARKEANKTLYYLEKGLRDIKNWQLIGLLGGLIPSLLLSALFYKFSVFEFAFVGVIFICLGISGGLIGAYIGKKSVKTSWVSAFLGAVLGAAGLIIVVALFTCFWCQ